MDLDDLLDDANDSPAKQITQKMAKLELKENLDEWTGTEKSKK